MYSDEFLDLPNIAGGDGLKSWKKGCLRFTNEVPTLAYSFGLSWNDVTKNYPEIYSLEGHYNSNKGESWPTWQNFQKNNFNNIEHSIIDEIMNKDLWDWDQLATDPWNGNQEDHNYTAKDQCDWIIKNCNRIPKKVLDVGGGRGSLAHAFAYCGSDVTSFDNGDYCKELYSHTSKIFFNNLVNVEPIVTSVEGIVELIDISDYDTIVFCETIEHFTEDQVKNLWQKICKNFTGRLVICNDMHYHPIPIGYPEHVREINDEVYDEFVRDSKHCIFRSGSHLVLQF